LRYFVSCWAFESAGQRVGALAARAAESVVMTHAVVDTLCLDRAVGWGRLSTTPRDAGLPHRRRRGPSQARGADEVAPVTFFVREDADWLPAVPLWLRELAGLSRQARTRTSASITRAGASFFAELVRAARLLKSEVEAALWELVAAGLVTADGFDNLRSLDRSPPACRLWLRPGAPAASQHGTLVVAADGRLPSSARHS
jgi:ATP-dependent Lhr-like helicase